MPSRNFEIIRSAIINRQQIHAIYKGYRRQMCPHALGYTDETEHALFYQFGGESSTGLVRPIASPYGSGENWRCVFVEQMKQVSAVDGPWYSARNHSQRQHCVKRILEEIIG